MDPAQFQFPLFINELASSCWDIIRDEKGCFSRKRRFPDSSYSV